MNEFEKRLLEKKIKNRHINLIHLAQQLPKEYIDTGIIDDRFKKIYGHGAGADEDNFGKSFVEYCISYTLKQLNDNKESQKQEQLVKNFIHAINGVHQYIFSPGVHRFKRFLSDPITGVKNHQELANIILEEVNISNKFWEQKKQAVQLAFNPPVQNKPSIYRIK